MSRKLDGFERIHVQRVMDSCRQLWPDPGQGLEQLLRLELTLQPLELAPTSGGHHFHDRRADAAPNSWQLHQAGQPVGLDDLLDRLLQ